MKRITNPDRFFAVCGMIAPLLFVGMTILGGALRPGYSHLSETVSELFSPGSPNKLLLDALHTTFAILLVLFGIGLLRFIRSIALSRRIGFAAAWLFIAMGCLSVTTATLFPQDSWGSPPTFLGEMHIKLSGVIGLLSIIYMLLMGIWFIRTGISSRFGIYSFITVFLVILSTGWYIASMESLIMGLSERITILLGFQWMFVIAFWMYSRGKTMDEKQG